MKLLLPSIILSLVLPAFCLAEVTENVDWPEFMSRHDLVYNRLPDSWGSGAFLGNGQLGANIFTTDKGKALKWHIGRTDVAFNTNRIPIGDLVLQTVGQLKSGTLRLDLWNAQVTGTLTTSKGTIQITSYTHSEQMVQIIQLQPSDGEKDCRFDWIPGLAVNPRLIYKNQPIPDSEKNPAPTTKTANDTTLCLQPYRKGGGHVTAWTEITSPTTRTLLITVGTAPQIADAESQALGYLQKAKSTGLDTLLTSHRNWWHKYWPASFISIPDTRLESFYWMQMYKLASATRSDRPALDLMGPWYNRSPWNRIWWNLNIQLAYWPVLGSNRLELGESLCKLLDNGAENLARNAKEFASDSATIGRTSGYDCASPAGAELCNLPWTVHNYYLQYRYTMDDAMLRDRVFPLLKRSINYYLHALQKGPDGKLHIPLGLSPEYPNQPTPNPDCNIDLALLRWGCQTLIQICDRLKIDDPQIPQWKSTLENLTPYPTDKNGLKISASVPFAKSHRHYSHLLMIYPLYIMNVDQPENRDLVIKSLKHWMGMPQALEGYSFTGASSISSLMGNGEDSLKYLNMLLDKKILPNTLYTEAGPCIETPLSAAASLHDMLLSSWGDRIRLFPALPSSWKDVTIHNMRTEGAFLVSAVRKNGKTQWLQITSLAGEPCRLQTDIHSPVANGAPLKLISKNLYEIPLKKGDSILIHPADQTPTPTIAPVPAEKAKCNPYGLH